MSEDAEARMKQVVGQGPRLEPLAETAFSERESRAIEQLRSLIGWPLDAPASPSFRILGRHPEAFLSFINAGIQFIAEAVLPPRDRELAILRTAWLCGAPFAFGEHVETGRRAGITSEEVEWVKIGAQAEGWGDRDRAILSAVEDLHADAMVSDANWAALAVHFDEQQLIELLMLVGHYHTAAFVQNSLRFPLNAYNEGLLAR